MRERGGGIWCTLSNTKQTATDKQTGIEKQTDKQTDRKTDRQTDRQKNRHRQKNGFSGIVYHVIGHFFEKKNLN